jgi:hypothetical protein
MATNAKEGGKAGLLLLVLVVLAGLCTWNYQRNAALEVASNTGPYVTLSDPDVDRLLGAYQSELEALRAKGRPGRANARTTQGVVEGVREFERVQRAGRSDREAGYALAELEGVVRALEIEQSKRRAQGGGPWAVFVRRAFTF